MICKSSILTVFLTVTCVLSNAQISSWTTVNSGDLHCDFPKGYKSFASGITSSIFYEGKNLYMAVTSVADTFPMKGNLDRDYSRDFAEIVLATSRKLHGRVREYRDTVIGNMPGYITRQEVKLAEGVLANYDLIQVLHGDSIRCFSSQYVKDDKKGQQATARFFDSIRYAPGEKKASGQMTHSKTWVWIIAGLLVLAGVVLIGRRRVLRKH